MLTLMPTRHFHHNYTKGLQKDLKQEVIRRILLGDIYMENVQLDKAKDIFRKFDLWTSSREKLTPKGSS
jgi:hypothetical protein